jgi:AcrR family transcriptional regulator
MKQTEPSAEPRVPLSRERVFQAAVVLADERGLESLTMRAVGEQLGIEAMSLYHYVANKDELLDGMVDVVFTEIELPTTDVDWRTAMRRRAISTREALARHRWAVGLLQRSSPGPASFRLVNAVLGCLRAAGFSVANAVHAYSAQDAYIYGFALQEKTLPVDSPAELAEAAENMRRRFSADDYPHIAETITEQVTKPGYDFADEFEFGLDLILDGLERLRGTA